MLIGWLAFSFYQHNAKKKKKQEQMLAAREKETQSHQHDEELHDEYEEGYNSQPENEKQPEYKNLIEDFLMGEGLSKNTPFSREADIAQPIGEIKNEEDNIYQGKNIFQEYIDKKKGNAYNFDSNVAKKTEDVIVNNEDEMELQQEDDQDFTDSEEYFDLRKAIIYSEILNRRYAN